MLIKITSKRQATFPKKLCEAMRLEPGHAIRIEQMMLDGRQVWVLAPPPGQPGMAWVGALRRYAGAGTPSMARARARMLERMADGDLD